MAGGEAGVRSLGLFWLAIDVLWRVQERLCEILQHLGIRGLKLFFNICKFIKTKSYPES